MGLGTQFAIERAKLETPHLKRVAPDFYPNGQVIRVMTQLVNWQQEEPTDRGEGRQLLMNDKSRVSREAQARFCEGLCQEDAKASCCTEDEGRSFGAAL